MNHYFVLDFFYDSPMLDNYVGTDIDKAMAAWEKLNADSPYDLIRFNEETKMVEEYDAITEPGGKITGWEWVQRYRAWFVVRHNPGFKHPETVISGNGIFETLAEAEEYIKANGGYWKMYGFYELQNKMAESIRLMERLKKEQEKK